MPCMDAPTPYHQPGWPCDPSVHPPETPVEPDCSVYVDDVGDGGDCRHTTRPNAIELTEDGRYVTSNDRSVTWRHRGWQPVRSRIRSALVSLGLRPKVIQRFDLCGSNPWIVRDSNDHDHYAIRVNTCRHRFCLPCQRARARVVQSNLATLLDDQPTRLITLTLAHTRRSLRTQIRHLYGSYRRLRQRKLWTDNVDAAVAVLEVTYNAGNDTWHPHLHVLCRGRYLHHSRLKEAWHEATRTSYIVHIQLVRSREKAVNYVTDYLTKPMKGMGIMPISRLAELIEAFHGVRALLPTGAWSRANLLRPVDSDTEWLPLAPLDIFVTRARHGDADAINTLQALHDTCPHFMRLHDDHPPPIDGAEPWILGTGC